MKSLGNSNHVDPSICLSSHFIGRFPAKSESDALRVPVFKIVAIHSVLNKGLQVFRPFSLPHEGTEQSYSFHYYFKSHGWAQQQKQKHSM